MVPRCLAQTTIKSTLSSKCPQASLSQKQYFLTTGLSWGHFSRQGCSSFSLHLSTPFLSSPGVVVPESVFTLKNYLLPTGRVDPSAWLEPCRTPKGLSWLCIGLLKAGWRTIRSLRKGPQKWKHTIWYYLTTIISPPEIFYRSLSHTWVFLLLTKRGFKCWCSM